MTHPVLAFHSLLFYTDVPSLTMVLLTWIAVRHDRMVAGGIAGLAAVCFRQTNIIWVAWAALQVIVATYHAQASQAAKSTREMGLQFALMLTVSAEWLLPHFILWALRNVQQLFKVLFPIIAVGIVFAAFVVANGSIVVGMPIRANALNVADAHFRRSDESCCCCAPPASASTNSLLV